MINLDERDMIFRNISDLIEMNRIMNNQAKRIQNRDGEYWKLLSDSEIEDRIAEYDSMIEKNGRELQYYFKKLATEYNWEE